MATGPAQDGKSVCQLETSIDDFERSLPHGSVEADNRHEIVKHPKTDTGYNCPLSITSVRGQGCNWPRIAHQYHLPPHTHYMFPQRAIGHRSLHFPTAPNSAVKHSQCSIEPLRHPALTCNSPNTFLINSKSDVSGGASIRVETAAEHTGKVLARSWYNHSSSGSNSGVYEGVNFPTPLSLQAMCVPTSSATLCSALSRFRLATQAKVDLVKHKCQGTMRLRTAL